MLKNVVAHLRDKFAATPLVGVELEFYIHGHENGLAKFLQHISPKLCQLRFDLLKEICEHQFELRTYHTTDVKQLLTDIAKAKDLMFEIAKSYDCTLDFSAKPFLDKAGNAFHIHVNLLDRNSQNMFFMDRSGNNLSETLTYSLGGLCTFMKEHMILFAPNESSYMRYTYNDIHTPTTISWGGNNRSTALRIPDTTLSPQNCRIEHRVPGADCDYDSAVTAILYDIVRGMEKKILPPKKTFGVASDAQYGLEKLPSSLDRAKLLFSPIALE
ncbi:glutamine synthetase [Anaplasma phagocytophilum str. Norway variant1]|uniref:Glutamine synthetase n=1 Tax=Anaplasma phagocytophilum str. Norway variant1 TaxID=1392506 RepID=A0A7H9DZQ7_ANAPH|nr:glutamine synthetase [Anaplasma phagocytophilum]QLL66990.1 glutamine synthetase [Anaplasma phagocytophilum str. Norway variant1]